METGSTEASPATITVCEDSDVLTVEEEDFENLLDVPFITVNREGPRYEGEVILSGNPAIDEVRIQRVIDIGHTRGVHVYARKFGGDSVLIFFTADTALHE